LHVAKDVGWQSREIEGRAGVAGVFVESGEYLRLAVFLDVEVLLEQARDGLAFVVGYDHVDEDNAGFDFDRGDRDSMRAAGRRGGCLSEKGSHSKCGRKKAPEAAVREKIHLVASDGLGGTTYPARV